MMCRPVGVFVGISVLIGGLHPRLWSFQPFQAFLRQPTAIWYCAGNEPVAADDGKILDTLCAALTRGAWVVFKRDVLRWQT